MKIIWLKFPIFLRLIPPSSRMNLLINDRSIETRFTVWFMRPGILPDSPNFCNNFQRLHSKGSTIGIHNRSDFTRIFRSKRSAIFYQLIATKLQVCVCVCVFPVKDSSFFFCDLISDIFGIKSLFCQWLEQFTCQQSKQRFGATVSSRNISEVNKSPIMKVEEFETNRYS